VEEPGGPRQGCAAHLFFFPVDFAARFRQLAVKMKSALLLLTLLILAGCASPAPPPAEPAPAAGKTPDKRVTVDPALGGILQINQVRVIAATQGYLEFQVDVQNLGASLITVIYQVDWLDKDGVSMGISMDEPPCSLLPRETHPITITSPAPTAKDFRLTFRPRTR
jgi:uncharacterized protein YcfL